MADMYGPTSDESNNNKKASFPKLFFFQKPFKKGVEAFERKTVAALQRKKTGEVGLETGGGWVHLTSVVAVIGLFVSFNLRLH